ncbi:MAG: DNA-3-methyladenine glycosylase I, partial [Polaribacter sp.]
MKNRCFWVTDNKLYQEYHDYEWGTPVYDDKILFEFILL